MNDVYALLLAGGKGTRLWPKSKGASPKHILCFNSDFSLLQETFSRAEGLVAKERIFVVTTERQKDLVKKQLPYLNGDNLIIEPQGKNTLPCILSGVALIKQQNPDAVMVVLPSDHLIKSLHNFLATLKRAVKFAQKEDAIVTVGIKPDYPATGYGYIKIKSNIRYQKSKIYRVEKFIEKPPLEKAKKFLLNQKFFWNSGIFVFKAAKIFREAEKFLPAIYEKFARLSRYNSSILRKIYNQLPSVSIDTAILEKSEDIFMIRANFSWCDLGSWECLASVFKKDSNNNLNMGENFLYKTANSIIINEQNNHLIATVGLNNVVVVHTPQVTLIQDKSQSQELKNLVAQLERDRRYRKYV